MLTQYRNLFNKAIHYWGFDKQFGMVAEENHEIGLLLEKRRRHGIEHVLSRVKKNPDGTEEVEKLSIFDWLLDECADNLIMLTQLAMMLGEGKVFTEIERKIDRLRDKMFMIDSSPKNVRCQGCHETFIHEEEITEETECEVCGENLYHYGFTWEIIEDYQEVHALIERDNGKVIYRCGSCKTSITHNFPKYCHICGKVNISAIDPSKFEKRVATITDYGVDIGEKPLYACGACGESIEAPFPKVCEGCGILNTDPKGDEQ